MADNTTMNSGAGGDVIRTEDKSGTKTPVSLIDVGGTGTENLIEDGVQGMPTEGVAAENAAVAGNPVLIGGRYDTSARTLGNGDVGAIALNADGSIQVSISGGYGSVTGGGVEASALRVTIASDSTGVLSIDDNGSSITVDNAGTFAVQASGVAAENAAVSGNPVLSGGRYDSTPRTLDDGDVGAIALNADGSVQVSISGGYGSVLGGGTESGALRVTIASDSTGLISVDDNGGSITVDGTVTANLSATDNAVLDAIAADTLALTAVDYATQTTLASLNAKVTAVDTGAVVISSGTDTANLGATDNAVLDAIAASVSGTLTVGSHAVTNAGTFVVQIDGTALTKLTDIETNTDFGATTGGGVESGALRVTVASDSTGVLSVDDNGGSLTVDNGGTFATQVTSATTGGATPGRLISAASTNATSIKASAGTLYSLSITNVNAAICYVKLYNKASAPTVGTDTPVLVYGVPGNAAGAGHAVPVPTCGIAFSTGIALAITTGAADSDTGAVAANEVAIGYSYK